MTTRVPRPKLESLGRGWGYGGARTHHGEGGEGLRDEAGDRGGEHSLLGHGSLGDGGLGDWIRRGIRGLGISSDRGNLVERARAGTNSRRGGFDRFARFASGWFGCTHRWPCGQPCGPRALREGGERGEGSRSALASSPDRARGKGARQQSPGEAKDVAKRSGGRHDPRPVRVRSRGHSLAATAHFMERDMQAILCVVVTVFATGVVCDYAPCEHALRREKHAPRRFPTGRIDRPCTFSANQIAFLRRSRY